MNYKRYINSDSKEFKVNDNLVEVGHSTWQIRNIAATNIDKITVPFNEPPPEFAWTFDTIKHFGIALATCFVGWLAPYALFNSTFGGIIAAAFGFFAVMAFSSAQVRDRKLAVWKRLKDNPPVIYSLMLETNAGSKPLFYSFDDEQISRANNAIKAAMEKSGAPMSFTVDTLNMTGEGDVNFFGCNIYNQMIQEG